MHPLLTLGLVLFIYMSSWFIVSLILARNDAADTAWGMGFVVLVWAAAYSSLPYTSATTLTLLACITLWGARLSWHITQRNWRRTEDARYLLWRQTWGKWFVLRSFLQIYMLQGVLLFLIALPATVTILFPSTKTGPQLFFGIGIWVIGFLFEAVADRQLAVYLQNPENRGTLIQSGLWRYSRHPNYFGEVTQWWGIWIMGFSSLQHIWLVIGPLTITWLILFVSGIPLLEERMKQKPEFASYAKRTSVFFPLPPRN